MTRPLALITWFRTQLSVARALLCASTLKSLDDAVLPAANRVLELLDDADGLKDST